jgi:hypothetical protein
VASELDWAAHALSGYEHIAHSRRSILPKNSCELVAPRHGGEDERCNQLFPVCPIARRLGQRHQLIDAIVDRCR